MTQGKMTKTIYYAERWMGDLLIADARMPGCFPPDHPFHKIEQDPDVVSIFVTCDVPDISAYKIECVWDDEAGWVLPRKRDLETYETTRGRT